MKISVVIPSYRGLRTLPQCLEALEAQDSPPDEVIVVDSSDDATADMVARDFPEVQLIRLDQRTLPGPARNLGVQRAIGDVVALLDADCVAQADWVAVIRDAMADPTVSAIAGAILNGTPRSVVGTLIHQAEFNEYGPNAARRTVRMVPTANMALRRAVCLAVPFVGGLFPAEDTVFARDLAAAGHHILFVPYLRIQHLNKTGWRQVVQAQRRLGQHYARSRLRFDDLPGSVLVHRPWLVPAAPAARFSSMLGRFGRHGDWPAAATAVILAPVHLGLGVSWALGFFEELRTGGASVEPS